MGFDERTFRTGRFREVLQEKFVRNLRLMT
jgi:hypothetical protein